jgi:rubrerythrin
MNGEDAMIELENKPSGGALGARFLTKLLTSPRGRAFMLRYLQSTEEADEKAVFDMLLSRVDDPELHRLVKIHVADEERHAGIFQRAVARVVETEGLDAEPGEIPQNLRIVARLDERLGGYADGFVSGRLGVMEAYVLLLVLEERAVREWPTVAAILRDIDPEAAADVERVIRDEQRHVKYARAISRRYAPDEATLERTIARVRAAEEASYQENVIAVTRYAVDNDLMAVGPVERLFWKGIVAAGELQSKRAVTASPRHGALRSVPA